MKQINCSECGKLTINKYGSFCSKCYAKISYKANKNYYLHYQKSNLPNPFLSNHKQVNILTSKQKVCVVCGNSFFTQGRINMGKTCSQECRKKHTQRYYQTPERRAKVKVYHLAHLKERVIMDRKRILGNPTELVGRTLRSNLRVNLALKFNDKKNTCFASLTGYSYGDARKHLEKQFTPNMSWGNYGKVWQVDHVVPLKMFKTKEQFIKRGWALKNLQPLESELNLAKQDRYVGNPKTRHKVIYL